MADADLFLFVSHVAEDRAAALEIVDELERRGVKCWIAPRDVHPGSRFDDEIADALDNCRAMLLIFSEHCNESEYIHREVTVAGESHKIVIPFRIEDVQPRRGLRVRLSDLHWIDGFASRERAVDELARQFDPVGALCAAPGREHQRQEEERRAREEPEEAQRAEAAKSEAPRRPHPRRSIRTARLRRQAEKNAPTRAARDAEARALPPLPEARPPARFAGKLLMMSAGVAALVLMLGLGLFLGGLFSGPKSEPYRAGERDKPAAAASNAKSLVAARWWRLRRPQLRSRLEAAATSGIRATAGRNRSAATC